ncbi:MAG TPA: hypothetical protein PK076_03155 [Saprospiraceae bacterium]|nr:hypothetical protein [Saprospiraceae bacterium]HQW55091.1 hypothetical protein [Saprospiraceae bacterium]
MQESSEKIKSLFSLNEEIDTKSMDFLVQALYKNNLPEFDYLEFKQSMMALINMPMEQTLAMKSAYTTGNTVGLTKENLLKSADFYKNILQQEKIQFDAALKNQTTSRIEGRKKEQTKLLSQIERNKELIRKLQEEMQQDQIQIDKITSEIDENINKIEQSRYKFEHTFSAILVQINQDIEDINKNL